MAQFNVEIELYGAFRNFDDGKALMLELPFGADLAAIKAAFVEALRFRDPDFDSEALVEVSAFADDCTILGANYSLAGDAKLAILPPVNGG